MTCSPEQDDLNHDNHVLKPACFCEPCDWGCVVFFFGELVVFGVDSIFVVC